MPDYDYIHKELLRNGVSKKLLWTEYMEDCRANSDEPLMYSQFCYIKKKVDVKVTDTTIEIFYNHNRIASHRRMKGRPGQYSTITANFGASNSKIFQKCRFQQATALP